jgi:hypothetical protein
MFQHSFNFLILVELEPIKDADLPSTLRLLMGTRTYLEWSQSRMNRFWERLEIALGPPIAELRNETVIPESGDIDNSSEILSDDTDTLIV